MAGKPSDAKTTIDSLAELLREKGKMELSKIAQTLSVEQNIVENWARVLEEGNLVRITNEVGKMYVEPITVSREQESAMVVTVDAERIKMENDLALQRSSLDRYSQKLDAISVSVQSAETMFRQKFPELEQRLDGINKIYSALETENEKIDTIKKLAETTYEGVNKKIATLYGRVEGVDSSGLQNANAELQKIQEIVKKASDLENQLTLLSKSKDKALETIKKGIEEQLKALEKDLTKAQQNIAAQLKTDEQLIRQSLKTIVEQAKSIDDVSKQIGSFKREKESVKKTLNDTRSTFNDEYSRVSTRMDATGTALRNQTTEMMKELDLLKKNFGEISKLYDSVQKSRIEIEALRRVIVQIRQDAEKASDQVRALQTLKGSGEAKSRAAQKASEAVGSVVNLSNQVNSDLNDLSNSIGGG